LSNDGDEALRREALRLNARYVEEIVIGWGLCPWAAQAWRDGAVARQVLVEEEPDPAAVLTFLDGVAADAATSIGLCIFPRVALDVTAWGTFAERVRRADRARRAPGSEAPFLLAAFHPLVGAGAAAGSDPNALVALVRRTPDPMLQLVRTSLLARLPPDVSGDIARANFATVRTRTQAALDAAVRDIRRDRDATYAGL
jgi:hypothetical protein